MSRTLQSEIERFEKLWEACRHNGTPLTPNILNDMMAVICVQQKQIEVSREALGYAAEVFRQYERLHAAKPDEIKAKRNGEHALACETALAATNPNQAIEEGAER